MVVQLSFLKILCYDAVQWVSELMAETRVDGAEEFVLDELLVVIKVSCYIFELDHYLAHPLVLVQSKA